MKAIGLVVGCAALAGCSWFRGPVLQEAPLTEDQKLAYGYIRPASDRFPYGPADQFKTGQWVQYSVTADTRPLTDVRIAVIEPKDPGWWIETTLNGAGEQYSLAQWVDRTGKVLKSYYSEPGRKAVPQTIEPAMEAPAPEWPKLQKEETGAEDIRIGSLAIRAEKVVRTFTDEDGRTITETSWWSSEIPPLFESRRGRGLVRRTGMDEVQLTGHGAGARRQMEVPKE